MRFLPGKNTYIAILSGIVSYLPDTKSTAQVVWTGAGGNNEWATGANWLGGAAPPSGSSTWLKFAPALTNRANAGTP